MQKLSIADMEAIYKAKRVHHGVTIEFLTELYILRYKEKLTVKEMIKPLSKSVRLVQYHLKRAGWSYGISEAKKMAYKRNMEVKGNGDKENNAGEAGIKAKV